MCVDQDDNHITPETPDMDPNVGMVDQDYMDHDQEHGLIQSLFMNS